MSWGMVAVAGASLVGGAMSSKGAKDAAGEQGAASERATEAERLAMERQIELQAPWREAGGLGLNALTYGLGLSPTGTFTPGSSAPRWTPGAPAAAAVAPVAGAETADQIRARLAPQFTTPGALQGVTDASDGVAGPSIVDTVGLNAAVQAALAQQPRPAAAPVAPAGPSPATMASRDPAYGNLLRDFGMSDFQRDPGAAFRMSEGQKALDRSAAAGGRFDSGRAMKDITRFAQGEAAQEYGAAYNRYNANQSNRRNALSALAGIGQTATNQAGAAVGSFGAASGANAIGAGNARAAGMVGGANAISGGISQGISSYQNSQMMNRLFPQAGGGGVPPNPMGSTMSWYD